MLTIAVALAAAITTATACEPAHRPSPSPTDPAAPNASASATGAKRCAATKVTTRTVRYTATPGVAANLQSLDLYRPTLPAGCPRTPIVVYVHGGGWRRGDKANQIASKVDLFARQQGWLFVSVNYRLSPDPLDLTSRTAVRAPTHARDVAAAIAWVTRNARANGADPTRVAIAGHSAGAHIVSTLGTDQSLLAGAKVPRSSVRCVVSLDIAGFDVAQAIRVNGALYENAFGSDPARWRSLSPLFQITKGEPLPDFLQITQRTRWLETTNRTFADALRAAGGSATLRTVPLDHNAINGAVGRPGDKLVTPPLLAFLTPCLTT
jgi:acetyl esterase/lipase